MKKIVFFILFLILLYTRFVNLSWGLPYPMHPDERNMAVAIESLKCEVGNSNFQFSIFNFQFLKNCFNPHFFAYGQFPLYLGYLIIKIYHFFTGNISSTINFVEATLSLRIISAVASVINVIVLLKIILLLMDSEQKLKVKNQKIALKVNKLYLKDNLITNYQLLISFLILIFSPYFIQFSHFGTTESLLMLFYSLIIYFSLQLFKIMKWETVITLSLFTGLAIATKVSSFIFTAAPILSILINSEKLKIKNQKLHFKIKNFFLISFKTINYLIVYFLLTVIIAIIFSPHNLISFSDFLGSINYESSVALGRLKVFYTRQFEMTTPILFQIIKIFPYTLGWPILILGVLGFFSDLRDRRINFLRFAFLIYFLPNSFFYAKWTRFMAPILPVMSLFAIIFIFKIIRLLTIFSSPKSKIKNQKLKIKMIKLKNIFYVLIFLCLVPGFAYLSVYQNPDVRFTASEWIYKKIPPNSFILFETANVVDVPIPPPNYRLPIKNYQGVSFDFYHIDENPILKEKLDFFLDQADYIIVPSRRIFANHYCEKKLKIKNQKLKISIMSIIFPGEEKCQYLKDKYPLLNDYYEKLFTGKLGFEKIAEFSSYPRISFFEKTLIEFLDENAEETWSVFDHPVIRIYKKV